MSVPTVRRHVAAAGLLRRRLAVVGCLVSLAAAGRGDRVYLRSGGSLECKILSQDDRGLTLLTRVGRVRIAREDIERIERGPSVFDEYDQRLSGLTDDPQSHYELGLWCKANGFSARAEQHLREAIALDPDFAPARAALGYVRVGPYWVQAGRSARVAARKRNARRPAGASITDVTSLQARLALQIRAIRKTYLDSGLPDRVTEGRRRILAIRDPAAILPLASVLSKGSVAARLALVEALSRFKEDEATLNLAVLALTDDDARVRRRALIELARRNDPRVGEQFRLALHSNHDALIRRAAIGLAFLKYRPAVPDLIRLLTVRQRRTIEVPVGLYFGTFSQAFSGPTTVAVASGAVGVSPVIGVASSGVFLSSRPQYRVTDVEVMRTEVLEALKQITGQNFGFDVRAWERWYEEHSS